MEDKRKVGGYSIEKKVGKGGMATFYQGLQESLQRIVGVKELHSFLLEDRSFIDRFKREALMLSKLEHPNIVRIYEYIETDKTFFIIMEYVEGVDLKAIIKNVGNKMPEQIALLFLYFILKGLSFAHAQGVTHRDIKPGNILVSKDGYVKIVDFGLAHSEDAANLTMTGTLMGTPAYMAPEQAKGEVADNQSDIFSTGIIFYELLTGAKPYGETSNYMSIIAKILSPDPIPVPKLDVPFSESVISIYAKMVEKDKNNRYKNCEEVITDIETYFSKYGINPSEGIIKNFLRSISTYWQKFKSDIIDKEMKKGIELFNEGKSKYSVATANFNKVLLWEPGHKEASEYLEKIEKAMTSSKVPIVPIVAAFVVLLAVTLYFTVFRVKTQLMIETNPADAQIYINGTLNEKMSPLSMSVKPGDYEIEIKKDLYLPKKEVVNIVKGDKTSRSYNLEKINYQITKFNISPADAKLKLDGEEKDFGVEININIGNHVIEVAKKGYYTHKEEVQIFEGGRKQYDIPLKKSEDVFTFKTDPLGAEFYLGTKKLGTTPITSTVPYGKQTLKIVLKGYNTHYDEVNFGDKTSRTLDYTLTKFVEKYGKVYFVVKGGFPTIYIDDKKVGMFPIRPQTLLVGKHRIKIVHSDFKTIEEIFDVNEGDNRLSYVLESNFGMIKVNSQPWAEVFIDGKSYGTTPIAKPISITVGSHSLVLKNPNCEDYVEQITVAPGQVLDKKVKLIFK